MILMEIFEHLERDFSYKNKGKLCFVGKMDCFAALAMTHKSKGFDTSFGLLNHRITVISAESRMDCRVTSLLAMTCRYKKNAAPLPGRRFCHPELVSGSIQTDAETSSA